MGKLEATSIIKLPRTHTSADVADAFTRLVEAAGKEGKAIRTLRSDWEPNSDEGCWHVYAILENNT